MRNEMAELALAVLQPIFWMGGVYLLLILLVAIFAPEYLRAMRDD